MKKFLLILIVCILVFAASSCSSEPAGNLQASAGAPAQQSALPLLSGYPKSVLPLYQPEKLLTCDFSILANDTTAVGKEAYLVTYESTATEQDLYKYYSGLLTENDATPAPSASDEDDDTATDLVTGKIGSAGVEINFLDNADDTTTVYLSIGISKDKYTDSNPYFTGYPSGIADEYGVQAKQEDTYQEQYYGGKTIHYITVYTTGITQQEFLQYYQKYTSKQNFRQSTSDSGASVTWQDQGFTCNVLYTGGLSAYVTIDAYKQG